MTILIHDICLIKKSMFLLFAIVILSLGVACEAYSLTYNECLTFQKLITTLKDDQLLDLSRDILQCYKEKNEEKLAMVGRDIKFLSLRKEFNGMDMLGKYTSSDIYYHKGESRSSRKLKLVYKFLVRAKNEVTEHSAEYDYSKNLAPIFERFKLLLEDNDNSYWGFTREIKKLCSTIVSSDGPPPYASHDELPLCVGHDELPPPYSELITFGDRKYLRDKSSVLPRECDNYQDEMLPMESTKHSLLTDSVMSESEDLAHIPKYSEKTNGYGISTITEELYKLSVDGSTIKRSLDVEADESICNKKDFGDGSSSWMSWIDALKTKKADKCAFGLEAAFELNSRHSRVSMDNRPKMEEILSFKRLDDNVSLPFMLGKRRSLAKSNQYSLVPQCFYSVTEEGLSKKYCKREPVVYIQYIYLLLPPGTHLDISVKGKVISGNESFYRKDAYSHLHIQTTLADGGKREELNILFNPQGLNKLHSAIEGESPFIKSGLYQLSNPVPSENYNEELEENIIAKTGACIFRSKHDFAATSIFWSISEDNYSGALLSRAVDQTMIASGEKTIANYNDIALSPNITKVDCSDNIIFIIYGFSIDKLSNNIPSGALDELVDFIKKQ